MENILSELLPAGYDKVADLKRVAKTNFLNGGLNIVYGLDGSGKSWQIVTSDFGDYEVVYLDTDGSNGTAFVDHCKSNNVNYINSETIVNINKDFIDNFNNKYDKNIEYDTSTTFIKVFVILIELAYGYKDAYKNKDKLVFIMDSFSSMAEGAKINNAEDVSPMLYQFNQVAEQLNICLVLIDHATKNREQVSEFKLEGNEGAKRRTTVTINKYLPIDPYKPEQGGSFLCERARGNSDGLKIGNLYNASSTISHALGWLEKKLPELFDGEEISKSDFTSKTKNESDKWIRPLSHEFFTKRIDGNGTKEKVLYKLKDEYRKV